MIGTIQKYTAVFLMLLTILIFQRPCAHAGQEPASPYSLEAETGDVMRPDGSIKRLPNILALPEDTPKPNSIYELPGLKPGDEAGTVTPATDPMPNASDMLRAAPAVQTSEETNPQIGPGAKDSANGKSEKDKWKKPKKSFGTAPATATEQSNGISNPAANQADTEKTKPAGKADTRKTTKSNEKPQPQTVTKQTPQIREADTSCMRKPLTPDIAFTLEADIIEYNECDKTLRAVDALYSNGGLYIRAHEIRMDLNRGILDAEGNAFAYTNFIDDFHYPGDRILYHMRTYQGRAVLNGQILLFSAARLGNYNDWPNNSAAKLFAYSSVLEPAASVDSLTGIDDISFTQSNPEFIITAQRLAMKAATDSSAGLTFHNVAYTDADGAPGATPVFYTTTGDFREKGFAPRYAAITAAPSRDYRSLQEIADYVFADNVHGKGYVRADERHLWPGAPQSKSLSGQYSASKQYIRGPNVLSLYADNDQDGSTLSGNYSYYTFRQGGIQRFSYLNNITDYDSFNSNFKINQYSVWLNKKTDSFLATVNLSNSHTVNKGSGDDSSYSMQNTIRTNRVVISLQNEPFRLGGFPVFLGVNATLSWTKELQDLNLDLHSVYFPPRNYILENRNLDKGFAATLYGAPLSVGRNLWFTYRGIFEYYSAYRNRYEQRLDGGVTSGFHDETSNGVEGTHGRAGFTWQPGARVTFGAHYLASRYYKSGYGYWHSYLAYRGSSRWSIRLNAIYEPELASRDVNYPENVKSETVELAMALPGASWLYASWDLDDSYMGTRLEQLRYVRDLDNKHGAQLEFGMRKSAAPFNGFLYPMYYYLTMYFH